MHSAAILEKEVRDLRYLNVKQKQKRTQSRRQIPHEEGLLNSSSTPGQDGLHHLYSRAHEGFTEV